MIKKFVCFILLGLMILTCVACGDTGTNSGNNEDGQKVIRFWLSPDGSDRNKGTEEKPLETVEEALSRIRDEEYDQAYVYFMDGEYYMEEAVDLDGSDHDITFCAAEEANPSILGAFPVSGWKEETVNGITMWVTEIEESKRGFESLFSKEESLPQSRWPKEGYFAVESANTKDGYGTTDPNLAMQYAMYLYTDQSQIEGMETFDVTNVTNLTDVTLKIIHWWKDETVKVKNFDYSTGRIEFSKPATMTIKRGDRYYFMNVFEAMSEPGEWYINDETGKLYYIPKDGEEIGKTQLYAAQTERFVTATGAKNIVFEGLNFAMTDWSIPTTTWYSSGADHHQAAYDVTPAFYFTSSEDITFDNCTFNNINNTCLKFGYDVQGINVTNNSFQSIGANAIFLVGENIQGAENKVTKNFLISNNLIEDYGQVYHNATAVGIIHAAEGEISNNEIHDGYYTAITVGWVWGYGYSVTADVLIKQNLIYNVGQNLLSDMGAIYTLGVKEGIEITENIVHDVQANMEYGYGGWGIYTDEGSSNVMITKNLVYDCSSTSFYQHYGQDNIVMNNILAFSDQGQVALAREQDHIGFHLIRNIIVSDGTAFWAGIREENQIRDTSNFYWDYTNGDQGVIPERYYEAYGMYHMATFVDPKFVNAEERDFNLRSFSPAIEAGFVPWDISQAGLKND